MFDLDLRSRKPIYEQLVEKIKEAIVTKVLKADEKLPSVRMLSSELTINPNTIQKAYRELERQGYVYSSNRKGYFVAPIELISNEEKIEKELKPQFMQLLQEAIYLGLTKEELLHWFEEAKDGGVK